MNYIYILSAGIFGLIVGSFLNVVVWRLPRHEKLTGRSHCPHCHRQLRAFELVPVLSYVALRGRCASCRGRISPRYALIELATGALFALVWQQTQPAIPLAYALAIRDLLLAALFL